MANKSGFPRRLIVSFFSGSITPEREEAYKALGAKAGSGESLLIAAGEATNDPRAAPYAELRLAGESVGLSWVHPRDLSGALEILSAANADSIFLIPDTQSADLPGLTRFSLQEAGRFRLPERLARAYEGAEGSWKYLAETYRLGHIVSPAARWLIDNSYLIRTQVADIRAQFPIPLRKELGSLGAEVYQLAIQLVEQANYSVSPSALQEFLLACQTDHRLSIAQLWFFPLFLRVVLIEELSRLGTRMVRAQLLRELAFLWADRLAASARKNPEIFDRMLQRLQQHETLADEPDFAAALTEQLQDREAVLVPVQQWIEARWHCPAGDLVRAEHTREAAESLLAANAFGTLRTLAQLDFKDIFEATNATETLLRQDPGGIYPRSDFATRDRCRQVVERLSRQSGLSEPEIANTALALVAEVQDKHRGHVAQFLLGAGLNDLESRVQARISWRLRFFRLLRQHPAPVYLGGIFSLTAVVAVLVLNLAWNAGIHQPKLLALLGLLSIFPLSELAIQITHALLISLLSPTPLPKLDFRDGIPEDAATLVVVPMMLSSLDTVQSEVEKLEVRYLANREPNLFFSLFSDFTDADTEVTPGDAALIEAARMGIATLNTRYGVGHFLLFHRERTWSLSEGRWIGRERKRGKIEELNAFLCGETSGNILAEGRLPVKIRYAITLDADTQLPPSTALHMVETIAHPLNRIEIDPGCKIRRQGYAIIQPRVSIALPGATATRFTRIFADAHGTDPYCSLVSDAQQDLFGEAIFHGKAIYDVPAFHGILSGRFPKETLLSHDLIEGAHVGVGLATDIELLENLPLNYPSFARRQHRWIRGDWQIAAWSRGKVPGPDGAARANPLPLLSRWRIFDNLRRSLVPIASVLLLLFGWFFSVVPGVWSIVVGLAVAIPAIAPLLERWSHQLEGSVYGWQGAADDLVRTTVMVAFLPHQAWVAADAIVRALHRGLISKEKLLEWETADAAEASGGRYVDSTMRQMTVISGVSCLSLIALGLEGSLPPTSAFLALWISSPWLMRWLGSEGGVFRAKTVRGEDSTYLRLVARRTWRYFDDLVNDQSHWLPPDNSQLALRIEVAQRTSPTNIGLWLVSAVAAWDFGYLTVDELRRRCGRTLATVERLEKYEGHILNWYDTASLQPLMPRYVSTVDSGNLVASLWVLAQACKEISTAPLLQPSSLRGLADTLAILREASGEDPSLSAVLRGLRGVLRSRSEQTNLPGRLRLAAHYAGDLRETLKWRTSNSEEVSYWAARLASELDAWSLFSDRYLGWMETLRRPPDEFVKLVGPEATRLRRLVLQQVPSLQELANGIFGPFEALLARRTTADIPPPAAVWLAQLDAEYREAMSHAVEALADLHSIELAAQRTADQTRMQFLYDSARRLFAVGYAVGEPVIFKSHYDLLASECRLASLVSIAKGDVPMDHWFALGRPRIATPRQRAFLSWSGTMFEYLMPLVFTQPFENSLLERASQEAVEAQIAYGEQVDLPWGVSECAYSALDANQTYQYRAFGVPELALNPIADPGPVVAPYATMLALLVDPNRAVDNLRRLETFGLTGPMGFYESIDFTRQSKKGAEKGIVTFAYMAHHQGMSLLAIDNVLLDSRMQNRFHSDLRIRAVRSLLFERIPIARTKDRQASPIHVAPPEAVVTESAERTWTESTVLPQVHLNSNGSYSLMITNSGGGYSRWKGIDVTRWRADTTLDDWGTFCWIREVKSGAIWSPTRRPFGTGQTTTTFSPDRAEFRKRSQDFEAVLEVTVATGEDAELRRLTVSNRSLRSQTVEITFYAELALTSHTADRAHPAFAKMFVQTEALDDSTLLAWRRPRSPQDTPIFVGCVLLGAASGVQHETSRPAFLGRAKTLETAISLARPLGGTTGTVIDPVFSLRGHVEMGPRENRTLTFVVMAAASRDAVIAMLARFRRPDAVSTAFELAWTRAQLELRYLGMRPGMAHRFQELASHILYPFPRLRATNRMPMNELGQAALWSHGISGDLPILSLTVGDLNGLPVLREVLLAWQFWRIRGLDVDLIILNRERPSYDLPLRQALATLIEAQHGDRSAGTGKVFLVDWHGLTEAQQNLLLSVARVVLGTHLGPLQRQLLGSPERVSTPRLLPASRQQVEVSPPLPFLELPYFNGIGGFTAGGQEYAIYMPGSVRPPAPWANVIANPRFGTVLTESGLGFTWFANSQQNRLTPWHNDPVSDPQSEIVFIRDDDTGTVWTPTALPIREAEPYRARHGQGYTIYEHNSQAIGQELTVLVAENDPVKLCRLVLRNHSTRPRRLSVTYYVEWVLGSVREEMGPHVRTSYDAEAAAVTASQPWTGSYSGQLAFASSTPRASSYSCDRTNFLGRDGSVARPAVLAHAGLGNRCGEGSDPCAALQVPIVLAPGEQREVTFMLGSADSVEMLRTLVAKYREPSSVHSALQAVRQSWESRLTTIQVRTPVLSVDFLLNRWLPYQTLSCRFWARSATYQSGGAIGFRDQLQDSLALIYSQPNLTRAHILTAASRQFPEGDAQHWWHAGTGLGVRTHCSDDYLWLPWVTVRYAAITGDAGILDESVAFLDGPAIPAGESEFMFQPTASSQRASLWEHCRRSIALACTRLGPHGLPLFGSGDWNDGMNRVGVEGRGESIWLAWFLISILIDAADIEEQFDPALAQVWRQRAAAMEAATELHGWDGDWYLRGFFDDGSPLGSHNNTEACIDSLPQSWAVLSGAGNAERSARAMASADQQLVRSQEGLVLLFTPPFDHSAPHPGYIMGYPPGMRENGGQYTHGSLWMAQARAAMRDGDGAVALLQLMNPVERTRTPPGLAAYRGEPYVVAADVSAAEGRVGASGWTWYTGSSGWMYRIWLEDVLGFRVRGNVLRIAPVIPNDWPGFELHYRFGASTYHIEVRRDLAPGAILDGQRLPPAPHATFPLIDDGSEHHIQVLLPMPA